MARNHILGDCHTHLDQYAPAELPGILERAGEAGVGFAVCAGTTLESTRACVELSSRYGPLYAGVGIHPMEAHRLIDEETLEELPIRRRPAPELIKPSCASYPICNRQCLRPCK